jgi:DNA-binding transcriptional MerR regulator
MTQSDSDLDNTFDLNDLCRLGDVTARTVRYYVQQGLLPSPGLGAGARYSPRHLDRLRLIRRLQREHLPLAEIRRRLEGLGDKAIRALADAPVRRSAAPLGSAVDYVRAALGASRSRSTSAPARGSRPAPPRAAQALPSSARPPATDRAQWERIALSPDVEIHVRRPLSREDNRRLEKLIAEAQALFGKEQS